MSDSADELDLLNLVRVLLRYRWVLIGVATACIGLSVLVAMLSTPIYRAEVLIAPADDGSSSDSLSSLLSGVSRIPGLGMLNSDSARRGKVAEAIATLRSPQFTMEFIEENELLPVLFAGLWDAGKQDWIVDNPEDAPTLTDGYILFREKIREVIEGDDGIITFAIEWKDPELSANWANMLIAKLNQRMRTRAIDEANKTLAFLRQEVEKTQVVEVQQAIYSMVESQLNTRTIANVREEYAFKVISAAHPPDPDRFVKPRRLFIVALGTIAGLALGVFSCFLVFAIRHIRSGLGNEVR